MKTASPETLLRAPKDVPWKMGPFRIVNVALSYEGRTGLTFLWRGRSCCRGVWFDTVAKDRTRKAEAVEKTLVVLGTNVLCFSVLVNMLDGCDFCSSF